MSSAPLERRRIIFHGRVQGVFFRATTAQLAHGLPLSGHVRNRDDGTVESEVQGAPEVIERLLAAVRRAYAGNITREDAESIDVVAGERLFAVRD